MATVVAVSGCALHPGGGTQPSAGPSTPTAVKKSLAKIDDLADACFPERGFYPEADAYTGAGPHPIIAFDEDSIGGMSSVLNSPVQSQELFEIPEPRRYQLITCLGKSLDGGEYLGDCTFNGGIAVPQFRGQYDAVVYEAKTGREVARVSVSGKHVVGCGLVEHVDRSNPKLYTSADLDELLVKLGPFVG
ncbi:hypothetical protein ACFYUD_13555 [Nocardia tengchongensis]|uniref:hypothetical protein n=1 Tax=Nocardia tengchongensis TaxID=2055889 RepID=UPI00367650B4